MTTYYSQNGYAVDASKIKTYTVQGTNVKLPLREGDTATILLYVAKRFNLEVEPLHSGWCWGFAVRPIRGETTGYSNHASGTAEDFNAPKHPRGTKPSANFTRKQRAAIAKILKDCDGVVRWGGNYTSAPLDGMHFEINATPAVVAKFAAKIKADPLNTMEKLQKAIGLTGKDVDGKLGPKTQAQLVAIRKTTQADPKAHQARINAIKTAIGVKENNPATWAKMGTTDRKLKSLGFKF